MGPRSAGSPGAEKTRDYIVKQLSRCGLTAEEQAFDAADAGRRRPDGEPPRDDPGRQSGAKDRLIIAGHYDTKLLPEFAFVGANDGGSSTAFLLEIARVAERRGRTRCRSSCCSSTAKKPSSNWHGQRSHLRQPLLRRGGEEGRDAATDIQAFILVDMIGDRDLRISARAELDAVADRRHLGHREAAESPRVRRRTTRRSKTTTSRSWRPASRRSTSSTSTTPPGTPPATRSTRSRRRVLQAVGDVLLAALPEIEKRLLKP